MSAYISAGDERRTLGLRKQFIQVDIVLRHTLTGEAALEVAADARAIERWSQRNCRQCLGLAVDNEARDAML